MTPDDLRKGMSPLGKFIFLGGHHSTLAFKGLCEKYTKDIESQEEVPAWASDLWDPEKKEVVPVRDMFIYRYSDLPTEYGRAPGKADISKGPQTPRSAAESHALRMQFARLIASTDNMTQKDIGKFNGNTTFM